MFPNHSEFPIQSAQNSIHTSAQQEHASSDRLPSHDLKSLWVTWSRLDYPQGFLSCESSLSPPENSFFEPIDRSISEAPTPQTHFKCPRFSKARYRRAKSSTRCHFAADPLDLEAFRLAMRRCPHLMHVTPIERSPP